MVIEKSHVELFSGRLVGVVAREENTGEQRFFRGKLVSVGIHSLVLEFSDGRLMTISYESVYKIREIGRDHDY